LYPVQTHTQCTRLHTGSLGPQPLHLVLNTICNSIQPALLKMGYRCPKHVDLFMIINHNCCIKLVPLVISIFDARSHIHQTWKELQAASGMRSVICIVPMFGMMLEFSLSLYFYCSLSWWWDHVSSSFTTPRVCEFHVRVTNDSTFPFALFLF